MAIYRVGNMWSCFDTIDYFVITTNSYLKTNGALVMGRGIAEQVRDRFPGIDLEIGQHLKKTYGHLGIYGFELGKKICLFQVKKHYMDPAEAQLIQLSAQGLAAYATTMYHRAFALNFPGIGNGRLSREEVEPLLEPLPDNVHIWTLT